MGGLSESGGHAIPFSPLRFDSRYQATAVLVVLSCNAVMLGTPLSYCYCCYELRTRPQGVRSISTASTAFCCFQTSRLDAKISHGSYQSIRFNRSLATRMMHTPRPHLIVHHCLGRRSIPRSERRHKKPNNPRQADHGVLLHELFPRGNHQRPESISAADNDRGLLTLRLAGPRHR